MKIIKAYAEKNLCYIAAKTMKPQGIVVHSTGANNPFLSRYVDAPGEVGINKYGNHWNTAKPDGREVCVHAFIGYDKNKEICIAEILPLDICCWGVGSGTKGSYNYNPPYIQFEICEDGLNDQDYYNKVFNAAAEYSAYLCEKYGIGIGNVVGHIEAFKNGYGSNHADPEHWMKKFGEDMNDFREKVSGFLKTGISGCEKPNEIAKEQEKVDALLSEGDLVSLTSDAVYYTGGNIPGWVKSQNWYVKEITKGDRVVIDKNESGTNSICSPVNIKYIKKVKSSTSAKKDTGSIELPYMVKITADSLNIRSGAGTDKSIVGSITDRGVYTIVEEREGIGADNWGKLKSGAGWISLDFTQKIK